MSSHVAGHVTYGEHVRALRLICKDRGYKLRWHARHLDLTDRVTEQVVSAFTDQQVSDLVLAIQGGLWPSAINLNGLGELRRGVLPIADVTAKAQ